MEANIKPVYLSEPVAPTVRQATWWDVVRNALWNAARRPLVRIRQRQLRSLANDLKSDLIIDLLPFLWQVRYACQPCREAYSCLHSEVFVSSIKLILTRMKCEDHAEWYDAFLSKYKHKFDRNDAISKWINGL